MSTIRRFRAASLPAALAVLLWGCGLRLGDIDGVKEVEELAVQCRTDEALATLDRVAQGGGLGATIGDLLRVVILRDAGRTAEADAAMAERNERAGADAQDAAEAEASVQKSLEELRAERRKRTGRSTCD